MLQKPLWFFLILAVLVTACSPAATAVTPVSTPSAIVQSTPSATASSTATVVTATIPKHGDLIFIEFFAVT